MLDKTAREGPLVAELREYLRETLGLPASFTAWPGVGKLPYHLHGAFDLRELTLTNHRLLLAINNGARPRGLAGLRAQMDTLRRLTELPVVYVTEALASWERKRLIEQKLPFLVPGNQLYLPDLGIDLREHFRTPRPAPDNMLSPATQAMLISALLRTPWASAWQPAETARELGYTPMTLSRAVKELTTAGIASLRTHGRARWLETERTAAGTWEHAKPLLRTPVKRRFFALWDSRKSKPAARLAGLSALARDTMIAEPEWPTYALSPTQWKAAKADAIEMLPERLPGAAEWEVWHYDPAFVTGTDTVDPLSLSLSLQDSRDDRVQLALDELEERFPW